MVFTLGCRVLAAWTRRDGRSRSAAAFLPDEGRKESGRAGGSFLSAAYARYERLLRQPDTSSDQV
jgi:hypothetical protein